MCFVSLFIVSFQPFAFEINIYLTIYISIYHDLLKVPLNTNKPNLHCFDAFGWVIGTTFDL